jgi:hypothetical protein
MDCKHNDFYYDTKAVSLVCSLCKRKRMRVETLHCYHCRARHPIIWTEPMGLDIFYKCGACKDLTIAKWADKRDTIEWQ